MRAERLGGAGGHCQPSERWSESLHVLGRLGVGSADSTTTIPGIGVAAIRNRSSDSEADDSEDSDDGAEHLAGTDENT